MKLALLAVIMCTFAMPASAQTFFNFSASDTAEVKEKESAIDKGEKKYTINHAELLKSSPLALGYSGGNFNLPSEDPNKRNPLAPPPLSSDDITLAENATYQKLVAFLQTCLINPISSTFPGISQSNVLFQEIPRIIERGEIVNPKIQNNNGTKSPETSQ